jgi:hypothetical protein
VALIAPQFIRRRDDKGVNATDLRVEQVKGLVEVPLVDRDARQCSLPPSQVLRRAAWTKKLKGKTAVPIWSCRSMTSWSSFLLARGVAREIQLVEETTPVFYKNLMLVGGLMLKLDDDKQEIG